MDIKKELYIENEYGYTHQDPDAVLSKEVIQEYKEKYNINTNVHRTCVNCQIRQIEKYKKENDDDPKGFKVKCDFIPKGLPAGSASKVRQIADDSDIPYDRAKKLVLATVDPVAWAELMLGFDDSNENWAIRSYQKEQLRCSAYRLACREGRRSGKTFIMALKLVYYAFNLLINKGFDSSGNEVIEGPSIMIVTPYQAQLTNIFNEMEDLVKRNKELAHQVTTGTADSLYIKTPMFKMEFRNGGSIRGFVSGLGVKGDGSGGGTIRGQSADVIYLDEMDMIPEDILDKVITPILLTKPGVRLIATSTPIGKRGKFFQWCLERDDFKEDYYPSSVLPHWDSIKNELLKENTEEGFRAEYMAEFIEGSFGVFKPSWIFNAKKDYEYHETKLHNVMLRLGVPNVNEMIKCIGIDWNKNAGTEFFVMGYCTSTGLWIALDAINVPATQYSAKRWMEEVIRLNYKWKPDYIYADEGYGHTILEDLKLYSHRIKAKPNKTEMDIQTARLNDRLVSFNFSRNLEIRDPIDGKLIKKSGKHFLVENAIRIFEDGRAVLPASDDVISKQMLNYIITKRHAVNNKPVYGMENRHIGDHRLDALMLALGGLTLESSVYSNSGQMEISIPEFFGKEEFNNNSFSTAGDQEREIRDGLGRYKVPRAYNILKIMRGDGSDKQDAEIRQKYYNEGVWDVDNKYERKRRGQSFKNNEESSIMESIRNKNNNFRPSEPISRGPRRNRRGKRSWRK
jgi:replicative DNA helicase